MGKKLYIGNLSFNISEEELEEAFSQFGEIVSTAIIKDSVSGRSKGFGFIEYAQEDSAKSAVEGMNGKELDGRTLKVDEAREQRDQRPQRRPRSNNYGSGGGGRRERY
ncbi:TPA: RNA-binding protein [bacterium]|nr:RNA-binding protein [bacterium]